MVQGKNYGILERKRKISLPKQNIDWDVVILARNTLPFDRRIWMIKQVSGFCGTGVKMKLWNFRVKDECPLCMEPEDNYHVQVIDGMNQ